MAKILIIDDDCNICKLLCDILTKAGNTVMTAEDGQEGLARCFAFGPDLVITDIVMPNKEGIEVIRSLRRDMEGVKIIAISGGLDHSPFYLEMAQKLGANRVIKKPFSKKILMAAIAELLPSTQAPV
jgi:DNA-binding response OmpR family regulator